MPCTDAPPNNHYCRYHVHTHSAITTRITYKPLLPHPHPYLHSLFIHHHPTTTTTKSQTITPYYYPTHPHNTTITTLLPIPNTPPRHHHHYFAKHPHAITSTTCTITTTTHNTTLLPLLPNRIHSNSMQHHFNCHCHRIYYHNHTIRHLIIILQLHHHQHSDHKLATSYILPIQNGGCVFVYSNFVTNVS